MYILYPQQIYEISLLGLTTNETIIMLCFQSLKTELNIHKRKQLYLKTLVKTYRSRIA
jgi:hypothetical protein